MEFLYEGLLAITWQQVVMYLVGGLLIWLAIEKEYEPSLLLPMGFGAILVNLPIVGRNRPDHARRGRDKRHHPMAV